MKPSHAWNKAETIREISLGLRALVLCVARYAIEQRGGTAQTEAWGFTLTCTGIPPSEQEACLNAVDALFVSLQSAIVFDLQRLSSNISPS